MRYPIEITYKQHGDVLRVRPQDCDTGPCSRCCDCPPCIGIRDAEHIDAHVADCCDCGAMFTYDGFWLEDWTKCGRCGFSWNDAWITGVTPAPSAMCPSCNISGGS